LVAVKFFLWYNKIMSSVDEIMAGADKPVKRPVIKVENVSFSYPSDESNLVLQDINLEVFRGEFLALLGHNGSGKSTLAKLFNGLLVPLTGDIEIFGLNTAYEENEFKIRRNIGLVFQNPDNQMVTTIIEDDVAFGPENVGIPRNEIIERVRWALDAVGMSAYAKGTPTRLSGGQKQRIAIAGVLALKPKVIVLDESTAMLDPRGRREVLAVAKRLQKEEGITVILITHFMEEALMADRVVVLDKGKVYMQGKPLEVFENEEALKQIKLGAPPVISLKNRLREMGASINDVYTEGELAKELGKLI